MEKYQHSHTFISISITQSHQQSCSVMKSFPNEPGECNSVKCANAFIAFYSHHHQEKEKLAKPPESELSIPVEMIETGFYPWQSS